MNIEFWRHESPHVGTNTNVKGISSAENIASGKSKDAVKGENFEAMISKLDKADNALAAKEAKVEPGAPVLKFSNHAVERMSARGIHFTPHEITEMEFAAKKAAAKGSKDALMITKNSAAIVSLKNNTVVTVVDRNALKNNVFTNIDATIFI